MTEVEEDLFIYSVLSTASFRLNHCKQKTKEKEKEILFQAIKSLFPNSLEEQVIYNNALNAILNKKYKNEKI